MGKAEVGAICGFLFGLVVAFSFMESGFSPFVPFILAGAGFWWGARLEIRHSAERTTEVQRLTNEKTEEIRRTHRLDELFYEREMGQFIGIAWDDARIVVNTLTVSTMSKRFDELTDVELEIVKETYSKTETDVRTNRTSQIIGAAVGGAAFGVPGAVVGGLTGSQRATSFTIENSYIGEIILRCRFLDRHHPIVEVVFYRAAKRDYHLRIPDRAEAAKRFHAHLSNILFESASGRR